MTDPPPPTDDDTTPTLEETARRRAGLYQAILGLERAAARPAVDREQAWAAGVVEALEHVGRQIHDHIDITERPDGLYDEIVASAPRLHNQVRRLREEHPRMAEAAASLETRFRTSRIGDDWPVDEARSEVQRLLGQLVKHRQRGADLVWEAFNLDIGGGD